MAQPLWKTVAQFLTKSHLLCDPAIPFLSKLGSTVRSHVSGVPPGTWQSQVKQGLIGQKQTPLANMCQLA